MNIKEKTEEYLIVERKKLRDTHSFRRYQYIKIHIKTNVRRYAKENL